MATVNYREAGVIEYPLETRNALGETIQTWTQFARVRANVREASYSEQQRRQQVGGTISHTVMLRYVAGVTGKMRFRWTSRAGRLLYISSVVEQGFRDELELGCEEQIT